MIGDAIPQMVSISELQRRYKKVIDLVKKTKRPLLVLKKNKLEAVLLDPLSFQRLMAKSQELEERKALASIATYLKEKKGGLLKTGTKARDLFR